MARRPHGEHSPLWTDAAPAREHAKLLGHQGLSQERIIELSGIKARTFKYLMYGAPSRGYPPARRIMVDNHRRIMSVTATLDNAADMSTLDNEITRRKLEALVAMGWSHQELGNRLHVARTNVGILFKRTRVTGRRARQIRDLFNELWDQRPVKDWHFYRTLRHAESRGYVTAMAWDDIEDINESQPEPCQLYARQGTRRNGNGIASQEIAFLRSAGESEWQIAKALNVDIHTVQTFYKGQHYDRKKYPAKA